jgi:hypothetical protein
MKLQLFPARCKTINQTKKANKGFGMWKRLSHVVHNLQPQAPSHLIRFNTLFHSRQDTSLYNVPIVKNVATQKQFKTGKITGMSLFLI